MYSITKPFHRYIDERGEILGIINTNTWEESNIIFSKKGSVRGKHYHKDTLELIFLIDGEIRIKLVDLRSNVKKSVLLKKNQTLLIEKFVYHEFEIIKKSKWINLLSKKFDKEKPDIHYIK